GEARTNCGGSCFGSFGLSWLAAHRTIAGRFVRRLVGSGLSLFCKRVFVSRAYHCADFTSATSSWHKGRRRKTAQRDHGWLSLCPIGSHHSFDDHAHCAHHHFHFSDDLGNVAALRAQCIAARPGLYWLAHLNIREGSLSLIARLLEHR